MRRIVLRQVWGAAVAAVAALTVGAFGLTSATAQTGPVSPVPAGGTPQLSFNGSTSQVRQIVQCGGTMYAVGNFSRISQSGTVYKHRDVFSFSATAPYTITSWNPVVNGTVNSIALTRDCRHAFIGGSFNHVDGQKVANIAEIRTFSNTMVPSWAHSASAAVETLLLTPNGHLLAGGNFKSINGSSAHAYYASLNPANGKDDGYLNLHISGHYVYPKVGFNSTNVYNQQLSPNGGHVLAEGVFTSVGGKPRQQIFNLDLGARGHVSNWDSSEFNQHCATKHPFYVKAAGWSPDGLTIYVADTGFALNTWKGNFPLTGLCDAVAAFPAKRSGGLTHEWVNYSGCDSFYSVAADTSAVYAAGHERWADNANNCNAAGPGSIPDPGLTGFVPSSGSLVLNGAGTAGRYSRGRGLGADDMLITGAGLWVASDNFQGTNSCGGVLGHAGICFLPYS